MMTTERIKSAQDLTICNLADYISRKEKITFEQALLSMKRTQLYRDIMTMRSPMVCVFPPKAIFSMYDAEKLGDMQEYNAWLLNF